MGGCEGQPRYSGEKNYRDGATAQNGGRVAGRPRPLRPANRMVKFIPHGPAAGSLAMGFPKGERRSSPLWSPHGVHTPWWRNPINFLKEARKCHL